MEKTFQYCFTVAHFLIYSIFHFSVQWLSWKPINKHNVHPIGAMTSETSFRVHLSPKEKTFIR